jgi:hypothetical protein
MRYTLLCLTLTLLWLAGSNPTRAQDKKAPAPLDAKLRVKVGAKLEVSCQFLLSGKADQSFENTEYRYAVLDKDGNQVEDALTIRLPLRTILLPKNMRSVTDATDASIVADKLKPGEDYYFVVSVRNLTGLAKFKAP